MKIRPLSGTLIAEPISDHSVSPGGLVIPDIAQGELKSQFRVVVVGNGKVVKLKNGTFLRLMPEVKSGDHIVANTYAGKPVTVDGAPMRLMEQSSVIATIIESSE